VCIATQLQERNRELDEHAQKKDAELRSLMERSRKALEMVEESRTAEAAFRRERDDLAQHGETREANLRRLRHEWQTEKADLVRQIHELLQELEDYRRTYPAVRGILSGQSSASDLVLAPPAISEDVGDSSAGDSESPRSPPTPESPVTGRSSDALSPGVPQQGALQDSIRRAADELLRLLGDFDRAQLYESLETPGLGWDLITETIKELYRALGSRAGIFEEAKDSEEASDGNQPIGSSLLTIFEQGAAKQRPLAAPMIAAWPLPPPRPEAMALTEDDSQLETPDTAVNGALWQANEMDNSGAESLDFVRPPLPEVNLAMDDSMIGSRPPIGSDVRMTRKPSKARSHYHPSLHQNLQRRATTGRAGRPRSMFFSKLASFTDAMRRFSVHDPVPEDMDGSDVTSLRSDSSLMEVIPLDLAQPTTDAGLYALTVSSCEAGAPSGHS